MKIIVFGASGKTGSEVVEQALEAGHTVTAFVRTPSKITIQHPELTLFQGNVLDAAAVERATMGHDAVVSVLWPTRPPLAGMMEMAARNIVTAMKKHGVRRLVSTTGAGVRDPQDQPQLIDHVMKGLLTLLAGEVLRDSLAYANLIQSSGLDWTIARFPRLVDGTHTGKYRVGYLGRDSASQTSRADGADFVLRQVTDTQWLRKLPLVSYYK